MIIPIIYIFNRAFMPLGELFAFPPRILVTNPTFDNFINLFEMAGSTGVPMSRYFLNSLFVTVLTVMLNIVITIMAAYVFSKKKFKLKELMEFKPDGVDVCVTAVSVPRYIIVTEMGLINTWFAHVLPLVAMPVDCSL